MDIHSAIADYKQQREIAMNEFREKDYLKNDHLADYFYNNFQKGQDVPFSILDSIEVGKFVPLPVVHGGAIITMRQPVDEKDKLVYLTKWSAGSTLTYHYHSDCNEVIEVVEGEAKIYVKGDVILLTKGDSVEISANTGHQVTALKQSEMNIFFSRQSNVKVNLT